MVRASLMLLCLASPAAAQALYQTQDAAQHARKTPWFGSTHALTFTIFKGSAGTTTPKWAPLSAKRTLMQMAIELPKTGSSSTHELASDRVCRGLHCLLRCEGLSAVAGREDIACRRRRVICGTPYARCLVVYPRTFAPRNWAVSSVCGRSVGILQVCGG